MNSIICAHTHCIPLHPNIYNCVSYFEVPRIWHSQMSDNNTCTHIQAATFVLYIYIEGPTWCLCMMPGTFQKYMLVIKNYHEAFLGYFIPPRSSNSSLLLGGMTRGLSPISRNCASTVRWTPPPNGWVQVNVDSKVLGIADPRSIGELLRTWLLLPLGVMGISLNLRMRSD